MKGYDSYIKTTWRIPRELLKKVQHIAIDKDMTTTDIIIEAMELYLRGNNK